MQNYIFYAIAITLLLLAFIKDKKKAKMSLLKAWKSLENILPQMLAMIILVGLVLALFSPETISKIIGDSSGWLGVIIAAVIGSVTLMPAFVAFPLAAMLLKSGAGHMQLSAFVSTLTMVGLITFPLENKFFGKKFAIIRNTLAFGFAFLVALAIGKAVA